MGRLSFPYLPAVPISHVAQLIYAHSIVWICYDQAHENSTCLYLRFSNTKALHWGLKQKVCGVYATN